MATNGSAPFRSYCSVLVFSRVVLFEANALACPASTPYGRAHISIFLFDFLIFEDIARQLSMGNDDFLKPFLLEAPTGYDDVHIFIAQKEKHPNYTRQIVDSGHGLHMVFIQMM